MSQLYGHDGRGNYYGASLVDPDQDPQLSIIFTDILTKDSDLDPSKLDKITDYSLDFLTTATKDNVLEKLDITDSMLTGPQGEKGDKGDTGSSGVFDVSTLTSDDIQALYNALKPLVPKTLWVTSTTVQGPYSSSSVDSQTVIVPIGDSNLQLRFVPTGTSAVKIDASLISADGQAVYDLKRSSQYDNGIEGNSLSNYTFTTTWYNIDATTYIAMRESDWIAVYDRTNNIWWRCYINIAGTLSKTDTMTVLVEVNKLVVQ